MPFLLCVICAHAHAPAHVILRYVWFATTKFLKWIFSSELLFFFLSANSNEEFIFVEWNKKCIIFELLVKPSVIVAIVVIFSVPILFNVRKENDIKMTATTIKHTEKEEREKKINKICGRCAIFFVLLLATLFIIILIEPHTRGQKKTHTHERERVRGRDY